MNHQIQPHGQSHGKKTKTEPAQDGFSLRNEGIQKIHKKGQNNQTQKFPGQHSRVDAHNRHHHHIVIEQRDKGQGRQVIIQVPGFKGIDNHGDGVNK